MVWFIALEIAKIGRGDQLPQARNAGAVQFDEVQLVVVLRDGSRVVQRKTEQNLKDRLVGAAVADDENRPGRTLGPNLLQRRADSIGERDPRFSAVERVLRLPSAPLKLR